MSLTPTPPPHLRRFDGPSIADSVEPASEQIGRAAGRPQSPQPATNWVVQILTSAWLWGGVLTVGFYAAIPHLPYWRVEAERYFCAHWVEYVEVAFFLVGMTIVSQKAWRLLRERAVYETLPGLTGDPATPAGPPATALEPLDQRLDRTPASNRRTYWYRRLEQLRAFFRNRRTDGLNEHLSFLSGTAEAELQESHAVLNMIIWAIPILGFLGTVLGITLAIAVITPEQLDTSLNSVTAGLAVAFDTTAIGLVQSLLLGFASLFVRRSEERLLSLIDQRVRSEVHQIIPADDPVSPWLEAQSRAARDLIDSTGSLIESQTGLWQTSIEEFRDRWTQTLDRQREELADTLATGSESTLTDHARQLALFRNEFIAAYQQVSQRLQGELTRMESRSTERDDRLVAALDRFNTEFHVRLAAMWDSREREETWRAAAMQNRMEAWQHEMMNLHTASRELIQILAGQSQTLLKICGHEENLAHMQRRLTDNLEALRSTESFENAVHQLAGVVHLLTARTRREAA